MTKAGPLRMSFRTRIWEEGKGNQEEENGMQRQREEGIQWGREVDDKAGNMCPEVQF